MTQARVDRAPASRPSGAVDRAADLARDGLTGHLTPAQVLAARATLIDDPDPRVRAAALAALVRGAPADATEAWRVASCDDDPAVRRRAADLAPALPRDITADALVALLADRDVTVIEAAAWALGEGFGVAEAAHGDLSDAKTVTVDVVEALARITAEHRDPLAREAAVAALGAIGDPQGLAAVLHACGDRPAVRRRAVLALAPFDGPDVDAALAAALADKDWQVRQAAEDLLAGAAEDASGQS